LRSDSVEPFITSVTMLARCVLLLFFGAFATSPAAAAGDASAALRLAAATGDLAQLRQALRAGGDADSALPRPDEYGETGLMFAAQFGHGDIVDALLLAGARPDKADRYGVTALILAAQQGHAGVVRALLAAGARLEVKTRSGIGEAEGGWTAVGIAQDKEVLALLQQASCESKKYDECATAATQRARLVGGLLALLLLAALPASWAASTKVGCAGSVGVTVVAAVGEVLAQHEGDVGVAFEAFELLTAACSGGLVLLCVFSAYKALYATLYGGKK